MKVRCDKCQAVFNVDERLIKGKSCKARCTKCNHVFRIYLVGKYAARNRAAQSAEARPDAATPPPKGRPAKPDGKATASSSPKPSESADPPVFTVLSVQGCPLYASQDAFQMVNKNLRVPEGKPPCMILARDILRVMKGRAKPESTPSGGQPIYKCSGCRGFIRFVQKEKLSEEAARNRARLAVQEENYLEIVTRALSKFAIFQALEDYVIEEFTSYLRFDEFTPGDLILRKGDPGKNLYIIVSGKVEVLGDDDLSIAFLGVGEVFGEMSLLSGNTISAHVRAVDPVSTLFIGARHFKRVLNKSSALQMYFTRLLAVRMAEVNTARAREFSSGFTGKLSEMAPSELFQIFNMHQKTGTLRLNLSKKLSAELAFRDGELVSVKYDGKQGHEAFFELLRLKRGRFKFSPALSQEDMQAAELGDFMHLLMEGLRRIDEDDRRFLRTVIPTMLSRDE